MNIFVTDTDPIKAASNLCDIHIISQMNETAQLLSAVNNGPYRHTKAQLNHPCVNWLKSSAEGYRWTVAHGLAICGIYTKQTGKCSKSQDVIEVLSSPFVELNNTPLSFQYVGLPEFKQDDVILSYRNHYRSKQEKIKFEYFGRTRPEWLDVAFCGR